jgi:Ca-activated chloride channel family protein
MKIKILSLLCSAIIVSVVGGATLETMIEKADESSIITKPIEHIEGTKTGTNFKGFNNSSYQPFLENITIPTMPPIQFPPIIHGSSKLVGYSGNGNTMMACCDSSFRTSGTIGFSVGGAKDINNFRENIFWGYLPQISDITYEGLFYEYFFNTGEQGPCDDLFCPSYSYAISIHPLTGEKEYFLTVGLNSGILQSDFDRNQLNLVIVLDVSGSMGAAFNRYYYNGVEYADLEGPEPDWNKTKMEVAKQSIVALLNHLNEGDRLGIVLFDGTASVMEKLTFIKDKNMARFEERILEIRDGGSTNMDAGMHTATTMLESFNDVDSSKYENRIIFLTDAQPNTGDISEDGLLGQVIQNSKNHIYTTFIGIGVDFNSVLIEQISKTRGANYYSVHSSTEFMQRMDTNLNTWSPLLSLIFK